MKPSTHETPRSPHRRAPAAPRLAVPILLLVLIQLAVAFVGCSKLDPVATQPPPTPTCDPGDPNTPCCGVLAVGPGLSDGFPPMGTDTTLEVACWNMLNFPSAGDSSVSLATRIIGSLNLDVWGVEEIADTLAFARLLARMPGYAGVFSPDDYGYDYQKTGIIYRTAAVTLNWVHPILTGDSYAFTRPPIEADITAHGNGHEYHFRLIVQHLKAGTAVEDLARRRSADQKLHAYLETVRLSDPTLPYVVVGDWNGALTDGTAAESFPVLLADTGRYKFLDMALAGQGYYLSHPSTSRMLDHLMVNRAACASFAHARVVTLRPDDYLPNYQNLMSDHRPVMVAAPVFR